MSPSFLNGASCRKLARRMDPLLTLSATRIAAMIRRREVSALEVVEAHVRHVEGVNPALNAVVQDRFAEARAEARAVDARAGDPDLGPLAGVPCTIKECFALTGMPNTAGLVARKGRLPARDATAVARLRAAGAVPIGVTNVSELCMWMESDNRVYGRTNNPYDQARTVGGSSGGEGAIVGAGGAPFGLGSDIGGSIRMPAFFNGVFGHKPTGGLVSNEGQFPLPEGDALRYVTTGPLARRAEDLRPLLGILAGPEAEIGDPAAVDLAGIEVVSVEDNGAIRVSPALRAAQEDAAEALARRGARVRRERIEGLRRSFEIWSSMLDAAGGPSFSSMLGDGAEVSLPYELARWALRRSPHTFPALALVLLEKIPKLVPAQGARFVELGRALRREVTALLGPRGVMLYPPYPTTAPRHMRALVPPFQWVYTAIFNVLELPVTAVPLGLDADGLPLGVQVAAAHHNDHLTIAVALELERAFGGWVPPPIATR
jgi:fatty acid amide hydrolase 2